MPKITNGLLTPEEKSEIEYSINKRLIKSNLECFNVTNGIRPSEFSVILGKQGNGKSALCKTIALEAAVSNVNALVILSEEKGSVYKSTLYNAISEASEDIKKKILSRLFFDSMLDWEPREKNMRFFFEHLEETLNNLQTDLIIFDNFTTSFLGQLPIGKQGEAIDQLRLMASKYEIAIVGVFHTEKGTDIYKKVLDGESVRGNATSTNAGSYNYILTTYFRADPVKAILSIDKARYHKEANKTFWELKYDTDTGLYTHATKTTYERVNRGLREISDEMKNKLKEGGW